jgi:hypothetical protein
LSAEHNEFHDLCLIIFIKYALNINEQTLLDIYNLKVVQEDGVYKYMRAKAYTEDKAKADQLRDEAYMSFMAIIKALMKHFDPVIATAANRIYKLLMNYGDVPHLGYDAETKAIKSIIANLTNDKYNNDVVTLELRPWIDKLIDLNNQFQQFVQETAIEEINKPDISPKEARKQSDEAFKNIINHVEALATLEGQEKYADFARELNTLIDHYNTLFKEHYGRIHARIDISKAEIKDIPTQTFAGKPITLIPEVSLTITKNNETKETVELVFPNDFTITYKNNDKIGMATITVHGTGKYAGEAVTTFKIV